MDGLFIPNEIAKLNTLNWTEKVLLSIYWYRNNGKLKCCKMTNEDIYKELMVSKNTFHRMKTHLKELGYIRTDGGIRVYYLGVGNDVKETEITENEEVEEQVNEPVDEVDEVEEVDEVNEKEITENEEVDETDNKKNNKTDIVMEKSKSNIEQVIESLDPFYQDTEKLKYFYEKCKVWVEKLDNLNPDEFNYSVAVTGIKSVINDKFGYPEVEAIPNTNKKEVKSEVEGCFM